MAPRAALPLLAGALLLAGTAAAQERPPVIDLHLHALAADDQGPPPLGVCFQRGNWPVWDQARSWPEVLMAHAKNPPCDDPIWSPLTDDELVTETLDVLRRANVTAVVSGSPERVRRWREAEGGERLIPGLGFRIGRDDISPDSLRALITTGQVAVLAEVTNQYAGIEPSAPRFEPYLALAEELDVPVGIHVGTGPPAAPYLGYTRYRARLHSPLLLEEVLLRHPRPRLYLMHAGWPMLDDLLALLFAHPQVHVEVGVLVFALPRAEFYRCLQRIVEAGFGKRVMFGSDQMVWPGVIEPGIRSIEEAPFLTPGQKRDILHDNAARFLRLDAGRTSGR